MSRKPHEMRLIDRVLRDDLILHVDRDRWKSSMEMVEKVSPILSALPKAVPIVADDVIEYYYAISDKEDWKFEEFPCIAPPFPVMWIEALHPSRILSTALDGPQDWESHTPHRWGALIVTHHWDKEICLECFLMEQYEKDKRAQLDAYIRLELDENGQAQPDGRVIGETFLPIDIPKDELFNAILELLKPLMFAVSFMHCKNVPVEIVEPPPQLVKAAKRRGHKRPPVTYRVINIEPFRQHARRMQSGKPLTEGEKKRALHLMRGHFKTFTPDRPLLGKHVGRFWWNPHMRGSAAYGEVRKTYKIKSEGLQ